MARVIISAGHTENEPGAVADDLREVDLTHKIASKVTSKLRSQGVIVLSVPPELDLPSRIDWINKTGYREQTDDICVEIHINDGGKSGIEGWYKDKGENESRALTESIVKAASEHTGLTNQGIKSELDHPLKTLAFLHNTNPISSLIECLYIDNPNDQKFLRDESKLDLLADGIVKGITIYFEGDQETKAQTQPSGQTATPTATPPPYTRTPSYQPSRGMPATTPPFRQQPYQAPAFSPPPPYSTYPGAKPTTAQEPKDAKKMIKDQYQQILGRKVSDQDLNYFANLRLTEEQMIKRLIDSQEHADIVSESQKYKKINPKYEKLKMEASELRVQVNDKEKIIGQQNDLIAQKNRTIEQLQQVQSQEPSTAHFNSPEETQPGLRAAPEQSYQELVPQKKSFIDKILRKLNDIFD